MVRHYKRKTARASYSSEALEEALEEVSRGSLTLHQAASKYEIPYSTLQSRKIGRRGKSSSQGRTTAIPPEHEKKLAEGLVTMEKWGFGLSRKEVIKIVQEFVKRNNLKTPFKDGIPGEDWFIAFKNRHKLSLKKPQSLEYARKKAQMDPFNIETYFDILGNTIEDLKLTDKPNQIFNIDETSFALDPSKTKVVGQGNAPSSRVTAGPGRESTTLLLGGNAVGEKLPPLIVFKGKNIWDTWMAPQQMAFPNTSYAASENGWMEKDIFFNYFQKTFLKYCGEKRPVLLVYDGHSTHVDERTIECAVKNNVTILKIPPHSSHILQPIDLAVFKSINTAWDAKLIHQQRISQGKKLSKREFSCLVSDVWKDTSPNLFVSGFRKAGIYPFSREVIDTTKYDPETYARYLNSKQQPKVPNMPHPEEPNELRPEESNELRPEEPNELRPEEPNELRPEEFNELGLPLEGHNELAQEELNLSQAGPSTPRVWEDTISIDSPCEMSANTSFENLLLQTIKQNSPGLQKKRKKIAAGAEVITSDEYMKKIERGKEEKKIEEEQKKKSIANKKKTKINPQGPSRTQSGLKKIKKRMKLTTVRTKKIKKEKDIESSSDDDILSFPESDPSDLPEIENFIKEMEEKRIEEEMDKSYFERMGSTKVGHWVLCKFNTKKKSVHFVGQVTSLEDPSFPQVMFLRHKDSSNSGSNFTWPENKDVTPVDAEDIITILPEPAIGRRGDLSFPVAFSSYNLK